MGERGPDDMLGTTSMCKSGLLLGEQGGPRHERSQRRALTSRGPSQARNLLRLAYHGRQAWAANGPASLTGTGEAKPPGNLPAPAKPLEESPAARTPQVDVSGSRPATRKQ